MPTRPSLYSKFLQRLLPLLVLAYALAAAITTAVYYQDEDEKSHRQREQTLATFAHVLTKPLWDCDSLTSAGIIHAVTLLPDVQWAGVTDQCAQKQIESGIAPAPDDPNTLSVPLRYVDEYGRSHPLGVLSIAFRPLSLLTAVSGSLALQLVIFLFTLAAVIAGALWTFGRTVGKPLSQLREAMHKHEAVSPIPHDWTAEITDVTQTYNDQLIELRKQARHDALTGLGNRLKMEEELGRAVRQARRTGKAGHVLLLDLDEFKSINDTHGHAAGDDILCVVAQRLKSCVRDTDTVIRLGGDEFVIIATNTGHPSKSPPAELPEWGSDPHLSDRNFAEWGSDPNSSSLYSQDYVSGLKRRISESLGQPILWKGRLLHVGASIGVARFDGRDTNIDVLLALADADMYRHKTNRPAGTTSVARSDGENGD